MSGIVYSKLRSIPQSVVPVKAGTHRSAVSGSDKWIPAFARMTVMVCDARKKRAESGC